MRRKEQASAMLLDETWRFCSSIQSKIIKANRKRNPNYEQDKGWDLLRTIFVKSVLCGHQINANFWIWDVLVSDFVYKFQRRQRINSRGEVNLEGHELFSWLDWNRILWEGLWYKPFPFLVGFNVFWIFSYVWLPVSRCGNVFIWHPFIYQKGTNYLI